MVICSMKLREYGALADLAGIPNVSGSLQTPPPWTLGGLKKARPARAILAGRARG